MISIIETSGDYDLQTTALIADIEQVFTIQDKITSIAGITRIEASARRIPEK